MNRRHLLAAGLAAAPAMALAKTGFRTQWSIRESEGFDALCAFGPLSGKPFYARYYAEELKALAPRVPAAASEALTQLQAAADARRTLLGPNLCLLFSGAADASLEDLIQSLDNAEARLQPPFMASAYADADLWRFFMESRPQVRSVLIGLREAGFPALRRSFMAGHVATRFPALRQKLVGLDVIREQERLLGHPLKPEVEVILLWFSQPHGIRIQGQRFLSYVDYPDRITLQAAAHEILHPPFRKDGRAAKAVLQVLQQDALLSRILAEHNPEFGYNTLDGLLDEDMVRALEQIVSERLGFAVPVAERLGPKYDDGMHVLAAGLYGLMQADGFARRGGVLETWMIAAAAGGRLAPASLHAAAAGVLQVAPDALWPRKLA